MKNPVNRKALAIESFYGYMNIHLELLHQAIKEDNLGEVNFQMSQLHKVRHALIKLNYFKKEGK